MISRFYHLPVQLALHLSGYAVIFAAPVLAPRVNVGMGWIILLGIMLILQINLRKRWKRPQRAVVAVSCDGMIAGDLMCRQCSYNLRGMVRDGVCPECGADVARSLKRADVVRSG